MNDEQIERLLEALEQIAANTEAISDSLGRLTMTSADVMNETEPGPLGKLDIPAIIRAAATWNGTIL